MQNKNVLYALLISVMSAVPHQLICSHDFTQKLHDFDARLQRANVSSQQAIEQGYRIENKTEEIAKQLTALQKQMRPSLLKRFTKSTTLIVIGALAGKLYSNPELIDQGHEKLTNMWHAINTSKQEYSTTASTKSAESNTEEKK